MAAKPASVTRILQPRSGRLDDRVDEQADGGRRDDEARAGRAGPGRDRGIPAPEQTRRPARRRRPVRGRGRRRPAVVGEQQAAGYRADRDTEAGDGPPDADRLGPLPALGEGVGDDRQRRREDQGGERTHREANRDQRVRRPDEALRWRWRQRTRPARPAARADGRTGRRASRRSAPTRRTRGYSRQRSTGGPGWSRRSSRPRSGRATLTIVVSRLIANAARQTVARTAIPTSTA